MNKVLSTWFNRYFSHPEAVVLLAVFAAVFIILIAVGNILAPVVISIILAYLLSGAVKKLEKWRSPHLLAVTVIFLLFITFLLLLLLFLLPLLWEQMVNLIFEIPAALNRGQNLLFSLQERFPDLISVNQVRKVVVYLTTYFANLGKEFVGFSVASLFDVVALIIYLVLVPLLVFFFLRDGNIIISWFVSFLPADRIVLGKLWNEIYGKITSYIIGKILEIVLVAGVTIIAFEILGLHYAILLGALVGISVIIPYVGMVIVTVPIIVIGIIQWGLSDHFFYMTLVYTIINILDAYILVPILFAEAMNLHPLAIVLAVLIFGSLFGFWGMFFAIPLMALIDVVIESWPKKIAQE